MMTSHPLHFCLLLLVGASLLSGSHSYISSVFVASERSQPPSSSRNFIRRYLSALNASRNCYPKTAGTRLQETNDVPTLQRRDFLNFSLSSVGAAVGLPWWCPPPATASPTSSADATVTSRIFLELRLSPSDVDTKTITIGLFGKDAPEATRMLEQLVSNEGLPAPCKPLAERSLQREQLEANKVYNACKENESKGVTYDLSTVWRVVPDERIDVGSVSGKFVAREFPDWTGTSNDLKHDAPGVVSVRKGNTSGFGFTIYPGTNNNDQRASPLDETHLVVGRVLDGRDVVEELNQLAVVTSAKIRLSPEELPPAPSRSCRYGGSNLYCNEYKPLQKVSIVKTGIL